MNKSASLFNACHLSDSCFTLPHSPVADQTTILLSGTSVNTISLAFLEERLKMCPVLVKQSVLSKGRKTPSSVTKNTVPQISSFFNMGYLKNITYLLLLQLSIQSLCYWLPSLAPPGYKETQRYGSSNKTGSVTWGFKNCWNRKIHWSIVWYPLSNTSPKPDE